jgi:hypothetical protein
MDICCGEVKVNSQISGSGEIGSTEKNAEEQGGGQESGKQAEDNKNVSRLRTDISRLQKQLNAMSERYDGLIVQENTNRQFYTANEIHRNALKKKY